MWKAFFLVKIPWKAVVKAVFLYIAPEMQRPLPCPNDGCQDGLNMVAKWLLTMARSQNGLWTGLPSASGWSQGKFYAG